MSVKWVFVSLLVVVGTSFSESKVYTKCGLTNELLKLRFSRSLVGNWVCLIESESQKNTSKEVTKANGSKSLGLFQINTKEWCTFGKKGGKCNMKCEDLLNEDISDDSTCAQKMQSELGFKGWDGWIRSCYGRSYPSNIVSSCATYVKRNVLKELFYLE